MRRVFVQIPNVSDEFLEFLGYVKVDENEEFKAYVRHGEVIVVKKANPYLYVDDLNDARILKDRNVMEIPPDAD